MMTLQIDDDLAAMLTQLAEQEHTSPAQLIKNVLTEYLEDIHDARLAEQAIKEIERGEETLLNWEDVKKGLYESVDD
jgi:predicted DNA-binding protein